MLTLLRLEMELFCRAASQCSRVFTKCGFNSDLFLRNFTSSSSPLLFRATLPLEAEPMKKKKKVDANIVIQRELKKRRKLEKQIKKLEAKGLMLKPIDEIEGDRSFLKTADKRKRDVAPFSFEESEYRANIHKEWSRYKREQFTEEIKTILQMQKSQSKALDELRKESEELYQQAIEVDENLIPFDRKGPVKTPPIKGYVAPDGNYIDTTKKFDK